MPNKPKTTARTFRLDDSFMDLILRLGERLGGIDRTAVVRVAVRRLADAELDGKKNPEKAKKVS